MIKDYLHGLRFTPQNNRKKKKYLRTSSPRTDIEAQSICASKREGFWNLPGSCCTGILGCRLMFLINIITYYKEFQRYCDKMERDSHTGNKSGKFSRTASMLMRVLVKKINVQKIYKCNLIPSYYRYRNYLIILLETHLYLFPLPENLQNPKQWLGCLHAETSAFRTDQCCLLVPCAPSSAAVTASAFIACIAFKAETAFW